MPRVTGNITYTSEELNKLEKIMRSGSNENRLVERVRIVLLGRFGPFLSCPGYPECKYIYQEQLKMPCPMCGGALTKRRWKRGSFWGC